MSSLSAMKNSTWQHTKQWIGLRYVASVGEASIIPKSGDCIPLAGASTLCAILTVVLGQSTKICCSNVCL